MRIKIIDVSRPVSRDEAVYPGNPPVKLEYLRAFKKDGSYLSRISMGLHSGSHVDAPMHYVKSGRSVDRIELGKCVGWCRVADVSKVNEIGGREVRRLKPRAGEIILFKTRNSRANPRKFNKNFAHLNEEAARELIRAGVKAVGIDGPSIRRFRLRPDTVHPRFLKAGIVVYEGLQFAKAAPGRYFFVGLPLRVAGGEASPVRAVLIR